jgi:ParB/Sulfiredoxin domain
VTIIQHLPLSELKPWPRNARTHSKKQVKQLADSIRRFDFTHPVLIDEDNRILAGHGRVQDARTRWRTRTSKQNQMASRGPWRRPRSVMLRYVAVNASH